MSTKHAHCDSNRIAAFLDDRLTADEASRFESHLAECPHCRERLEMTAAENELWSEAGSHLRDDPLDSESGDGSLGPRSSPSHPAPADNLQALRIADYLDASDDPRMLGRFGGYEIVGIVGCGGMGVVLKGFEPALDRYVAIKVLSPHLATSGSARQRFAREARAAAAVIHKNVVAIHRVAESHGLPYLVMPYMPGDSLQKRLNETGPLGVAEILRIGMQVAAGLAAAHAQGLVHRDIKPANILLDVGVERVTITDFGLARAADDAALTRSGVITGTPQYMSPEQARGEPVNGRSDLFSLGSVLYAMCTGRPPFRAETSFGVLRRITDAPPRPIREIAPDVPEWLCEIIGKLHARNPAERFQSAAEVSDLFSRWLAHLQQPTLIPAPPRVGNVETGRRSATRTRMRRVGLVSAIGLFSMAGWFISQRFVPAKPSARPSAPDTSSVRGTDANEQPVAPAAEVVGDQASFPQSLLDEQALQQEFTEAGERASKLESELSHSPAPDSADARRSDVSQLNQQLDDLSERIDRGSP